MISEYGAFVEGAWRPSEDAHEAPVRLTSRNGTIRVVDGQLVTD